jgi:hypothetical protein
MIDFYTVVQTLQDYGYSSSKYYPTTNSELWSNGHKQLIVTIKDMMPQEYKDLKRWLIS